MLTLSRKVGLCIMIGDVVEVKVVKVDRGYVRIGIQAPREILVLRAEMVGRMKDHPATCMCIECIPSPKDVADLDTWEEGA